MISYCISTYREDIKLSRIPKARKPRGHQGTLAEVRYDLNRRSACISAYNSVYKLTVISDNYEPGITKNHQV